MSDTEVERSIQIEQENAQKSQSHGEQDQESRQRAVVMLAVVALLVICALFLWLFLGVFYPHYNKNVVKESAYTLIILTHSFSFLHKKNCKALGTLCKAWPLTLTIRIFQV